MIDWERVAVLRHDVGEEGFDEVIEIFLDEVEEALRSLVGQPPERLEAALHFLKGGAMNIGFAELATLCAVGERAAAGGAGAEVDPARISDLYEMSRSSFLAGLARGAAG